MVKYILVTGGVISGIGKGIIASSTGLLLKSTGLRVTAIKIDPYLNIDAGLMNPVEHGTERMVVGAASLNAVHLGEVFVMDDGGEVDLDLGNYERFLDITLKRANNITTGKVYNHVIQKEVRFISIFEVSSFLLCRSAVVTTSVGLSRVRSAFRCISLF